MKSPILIFFIGLITFSAYSQIYHNSSHFAESFPINPYKMDINNDGIKDFWFFSEVTEGPLRHLYVIGKYGSQIEALEKHDANRLTDNQQIGNNNWEDSAYMVTDHPDLGIPMGEFAVRDSGYIGIKIKISGQWHYGWIRVKMNNDISYPSMKIYDYAYCLAPDVIIKAGQTTPTKIIDKSSVVNTFYYSNGYLLLNGSYKYVYKITLMSLDGKVYSIFNHNFSNPYKIPEEIKQGLYLIQIQDPSSYEIFTQKIFVNKINK